MLIRMLKYLRQNIPLELKPKREKPKKYPARMLTQLTNTRIHRATVLLAVPKMLKNMLHLPPEHMKPLIQTNTNLKPLPIL